MDTIFYVDGKPFFPLGGQARNSSSYTPEETETFWKALEAIGGNTAEIPIYWDIIEPEEGSFDFTMIDQLIDGARKRNFKLILLWFASWKNGMMKYAPLWVKRDSERFKRVIAHDGAKLSVLSTHCKATLEADSKVFRKVMEHIGGVDGKERTVIAVQVQNEPGILGKSYRDHGPEADKEFYSPVPAELIESIAGRGKGPVYEVWCKNDNKRSGNWPEVFGRDADEFLSAWSLARYIDKVTEQGKAAWNLPMYVNVWLDRQGWEIPGLDYPSGAPEEKTLDIWKCATKSIDIIAPDIYKANTKMYCHHCSVYNREDNALFVPESASSDVANSCNMFYAIGKYDAIGYFIFGLENILLEDGTVNPKSGSVAGSFKAVSAVLPLLTKYRGTGKIHPIVQEENMIEQQLLDMEGYSGLVAFNTDCFGDYHHRNRRISDERGRGLVIQTAGDEFYVLGGGFILYLREKDPEVNYSEIKRESLVNYERVEEGRFDANGNWVCTRIRNGDESDYGIWVFPDVGAVRVVMGR